MNCCTMQGKIIEWDLVTAQDELVTRTGIVEKTYGDSMVVYEFETNNLHRLDWLGPLLEIRLIGSIRPDPEKVQTDAERVAARTKAWRQHKLLHIAKLELANLAGCASVLP